MTSPDAISEARRQLFEKLRRGELPASSGALEPLSPRPPGAQAPLAPELEPLWLHDQLAGGAPIFNESITIHKRGPLDLVVLERCFNEITRRHEIWRSSFPMSEGKVVQRIDSNVRVPLPLIDLSHLPVEEREAEALRVATDDARRPFDLNVAPLFRVLLVRWAGDYHRVYLTMHRLVFDCESVYHVLIRELAALYSAYSAGQPSPLPELVLQYGDYAAWRQRQVAGGGQAAQMDYWRQNLMGDPPPFDLQAGPHPAEPTWRSGMETFTIPVQLIEALKAFAVGEGVTLYMLLLAVFQVLLYRYSGRDEIMIGGKTDTRTRPEFGPLMGSFVNTLVFRSHIAAGLTFREFLERVKTTVLGALANSEIPFDAIVRELAPKRDSGRHPLFQVLFSMQSPFPDFPGGWDITDMEVHSGASGFDLFVEFAERPRGLDGRFVYSNDLFDRATIQRLQASFQVLLQELLTNPDQAVSRVDLLIGQQPRTVAGEWNYTATDAPRVQYAAPGDWIERQLVDIWETLLGTSPIGVNHNFFELGGHSMLLAKLILQVELTFNKSLSMATVFQRPTIAQLADLLREEKILPESCRVFPIQGEGTRPPFICLGAGPYFLPLARHLGRDQPLLGVDLTQLETEGLPATVRLRDIGEHVAKAIREFQPHGPYYLGGFCLYGVLMYEVSQQIIADGGEVALLVLIDSPILAHRATLSLFARVQMVFQKWSYHLTMLRKSSAAEIPAYLSQRIKMLRGRAARLWQRVEYIRAIKNPDGALDMELDPVLFMACANYKPQPYPGSVALFQAAERPSGRHWDLRYLWHKLMCGPFETHDIVGGHEGMFKEPYVGALGSRIKNSLAQAQKLPYQEEQPVPLTGSVDRFGYSLPGSEVAGALEFKPR